MKSWSRWWYATCYLVAWSCISLMNCQVLHEEDPVSSHYDSGTRTKCYDDSGRPQRCIPPFENAAFNVLVEATNTCGENGPTQFCVQTGTSGTQKSCQMCNDANAHHAAYLTDFNNNENQTWWQSETMFEGIQYPNQVNLTLHLRKAFDVTYVRLLFYSPRPESFAIYKRTTQDGPWIPYQFYSATCRDTYGLPDSSSTRKGHDEARALCTGEYSDISPLTGGNVPFSTLEGRPSAYSFENSPELQEWVTATDIRITLDRLNTFGDEVFVDPQVLRSYFYAISDFNVGARCKCNGHASECVSRPERDGTIQRMCLCEHYTAGSDCNTCLPFYNDAPWQRATASDAHECQACNCNGFSNRCFFDEQLYKETGHGGHCLDCTGNRDGPNCERCKENYYQREDDYCVLCNCNEIGSRSLQCNSEGRCQCKKGVVGEKCDRCDTNYYDFGPSGCKHCGCKKGGSFGNVPNCDPVTGACNCKENVEGKRCGTCKPGFFNIDEDNEFGCTPCFCYGHSSLCSSAPGYSRVFIESIFARGSERWRAQDYNGKEYPLTFNSVTQVIGIQSSYNSPVYFVAPDNFLGDQRASYNQDLTFKLRIGESGPGATIEDIVLEGADLSVTQAIFGQRNPLPSFQTQEYKFRLHENPNYGWQPRLSSREFMSILSNLTAIRIRGTYTAEGVGFLDNVKLATARRGAPGRPARWIESCNCPQGYVGQFCESCAPGYRHEPSNGGPFAPCVPCNCNGHADICDAETGRCICQHNTAGDNCDLCAKGYYGNALQGTKYDCLQCPCPYGGPCFQFEKLIVCSECPEGYGGPLCDVCSDGYFGDPSAITGTVVPCQPCKCNDNIDPSTVGNCNRTSGECLKCIYNTGGPNCERCMSGFYGDALALPKGDCKQCQCYRRGAVESDGVPMVCDQVTGQCLCKPHVIGQNCDKCEDGYYNIFSGEGCQPCNCDPVGSLNHTCDVHTGQCLCRPGISGKQCNSCEQYKYGFSSEGCKPCECDNIGSESLQCDPQGQCPCLENVEGRKCDRCKENKYDRHSGCRDCPQCYNLVQDAVNTHRAKLQDLRDLLNKISSSPIVINDDSEFDKKISEVQEIVTQLWNDAKEGTGSGDKSVSERVFELNKRLMNVESLLRQVDVATDEALNANSLSERNVTYAEDIIERAQELLKEALDYLQTDGYTALEKAQERSKQFGQQSDKMSEIAREARVLAENQEEEAKNINDLAEKALNKSEAAHSLVREALDLRSNLSNEVRNLRNEIGAVNNRQSHIRNVIENTEVQVNETFRDSLNTNRDIFALNIPKIDAVTSKKEAHEIFEEAENIRRNADDLLQEFRIERDNLREKISQVIDLLHSANEQQQKLDELLSEADVANDKAEKAVHLGDTTLKEAQHTLETLQVFDNKVQESKELAQEALQLVPEIERYINEANQKTYDAVQALEGAETDAKEARDTAKRAQTIFAEQASQEADKIRRGANDTKLEAVRLSDVAEELAQKVALTADELKSFEDQAKKDEQLTHQARVKVGEAKRNAIDATQQVEMALNDVRAIKQELEDLKEIDVATLDDLEKRLDEAENSYRNTNVEHYMNVLIVKRSTQNQHINSFKDELEKLHLEVSNIEDIRKALPENCFKRLKLEP